MHPVRAQLRRFPQFRGVHLRGIKWGFTLVLAVSLLASLVSLFVLKTTLMKRNEDLVEEHRALVAVERLLNAFEGRVATDRGYLLTRDEEFLAMANMRRTRFLDQIQRAILAASGPGTGPLFQRLSSLERRYHQEFTGLADRVQSGAPLKEIRAAFHARLQPIRDEIQDVVERLIRLTDSRLEAWRRRSFASTNRTINTILLSTTLVLLLCVGAGLWMARALASLFRRIQESDERMKFALAAANMVAWEWNLETGECRRSENAREVMGLDPDAPDRAFYDLVLPQDRSRVREVMERGLRAEGPLEVEYRVRLPDGEIRWFLDKAELDEPHRPRRLVGVCADITSRKRAQEALEKYAEDLSRSNTELARFAFVASHDLKEPLRVVSNYVQLLQRQYGDRLDGEAEIYMGYVVEGVKRMYALINDLLSYSRIGAAAPELRPTDCGLVVREALANLQAAVNESQARVTQGDLPILWADHSQMLQLFQNLLSNAVKYRSERPPEIRIEARRRERGWLFSVRDNGIGIPREAYDKIFVLFQRLHGRDHYGGTGIGLALCKKIVERHGGQIWVESEVGRGTTFYFTLPDRGEETRLAV